MSWTRVLWIACSTVLLALPTAAAAQAEPDATLPVPAAVDLDEAEARALFDAGVLAFQNARYEDALERFERAYELAPHAQLIYNVAITADRLRRDDLAIEAFERYLETGPSEEMQHQVETRLAILRAAVEEHAVSEEPPPSSPEPSPPPPPEPVHVEPGPAPWILGGVGLALGITGGVLLGLAVDASNAVANAPDGASWPELRERAENGPTFEIVGAIGLGVGVALLTAGILWIALGTWTEDENVAAIDANGVGVRW